MLGLDMREIVRDIRAEEGQEREQLFAINPLILEWPLPFRFQIAPAQLLRPFSEILRSRSQTNHINHARFCAANREKRGHSRFSLPSDRNVLKATTDRRTERVQCLPAHIGSTITPSKPCHDLSICHKLRVIRALKRPVAIPAISHRAAPCTQYTGEHHTMLWSSSTGRHPSTHNHAGSQVPQKL